MSVWIYILEWNAFYSVKIGFHKYDKLLIFIISLSRPVKKSQITLANVNVMREVDVPSAFTETNGLYTSHCDVTLVNNKSKCIIICDSLL